MIIVLFLIIVRVSGSIQFITYQEGLAELIKFRGICFLSSRTMMFIAGCWFLMHFLTLLLFQVSLSDLRIFPAFWVGLVNISCFFLLETSMKPSSCVEPSKASSGSSISVSTVLAATAIRSFSLRLPYKKTSGTVSVVISLLQNARLKNTRPHATKSNRKLFAAL